MRIHRKLFNACQRPAARFRDNRPFAEILATFAIAAIALLLLSPTTQAQQGQGAWKGVLRNPAGAPISGAKVSLAGNRNGSEATTSTDGTFALQPLPAGQYSLTVQTKDRKTKYAVPIDLTTAGPAVFLTLSDRGELTVTAQQGQSAT